MRACRRRRAAARRVWARPPSRALQPDSHIHARAHTHTNNHARAPRERDTHGRFYPSLSHTERALVPLPFCKKKKMRLLILAALAASAAAAPARPKVASAPDNMNAYTNLTDFQVRGGARDRGEGRGLLPHAPPPRSGSARAARATTTRALGGLRRHARTGERAGRPRLLPPERAWRPGRPCRSCWDREWARRGSRRGGARGALPHCRAAHGGWTLQGKKKNALSPTGRVPAAPSYGTVLEVGGHAASASSDPVPVPAPAVCAVPPPLFFHPCFLPRAPFLYFLPVRPGGFFFFAVPTHVPPGLRRGLHGLPNTGAVLRLNSRRVTRWESSAALLLPHPSSSPTTQPLTTTTLSPLPLPLPPTHFTPVGGHVQGVWRAHHAVPGAQLPDPEGRGVVRLLRRPGEFFHFSFSFVALGGGPRGCAV